MKSILRIAAIILILAQLFVISASAVSVTISVTSVEQMNTAVNGTTTGTSSSVEASASAVDAMNTALDNTTAESSGAAEGSAAAENAEKEAREKEAKAAAEAKKASTKVNYEIAPVTKFGTESDVMIGGLCITPGVWYTVDNEGVLTSAEAWPDSYLYYSASQSKLTLHEFHYKVPTDTIGKESTYAALYLPKDMHLVLEGENELINTSYTTAGGGVSNGVYAPDHHISIEGNGTLYVNTRDADGFKGYGIQAGSIRIDSEFTGLAIFGMTSAFSCAPTVAESYGVPSNIATYFSGYEDYVRVNKDLAALGNAYGFEAPDILSAALSAVETAVPQGREMLANVADLHPAYNEGVRVREASPYDQSIFTRFRYVLFVVGGEISWEQEMKARIEAAYYQSRTDYDLGVEQGYAEAYDKFTTEVGNSMFEVGVAMVQEADELNNFDVSINQEFNEMFTQGVDTTNSPNWNENSNTGQSNSTDPDNEWETVIDGISQRVETDIENYWNENVVGSELAQMLMGGN